MQFHTDRRKRSKRIFIRRIKRSLNFYINHIQGYPIFLIPNHYMLIGKQTMDKLSCALLRKKADKPLHFIADDVDTTHLGHDPVFFKLETRIAEQLEMLSIIKLKAIIMQPLRISFISIRQYLIYDCRLFILIVYW